MRGRAGRGAWPLLISVAVLAFAGPVYAHGAPAASGPVLSLSADPLAGAAPLTVAFSASIAPSSTEAQFDWSFGDGPTLQQTGTGSSDVVHEYAAPGEFLVEVTASTSSGLLEANLVVSVGPAPLALHLVPPPTLRGPAPLTVPFAVNISGGTGTYTSFLWNFGNGQTGSGLDLNYTYSTPGTYLAQLTVTDSSGTSASVNETVEVTAPAAAGGSLFSSAGEEVLVGAAAVAAVVAVALVLALGAARRPTGGPAAPPGAGIGPSGSRPAPARSMGPLPNEDVRENYERVLTRLYWAGRPSSPSVGRIEATREGLARELRLAPSTVGRALRRLEAAGALTGSLAHVPGAPRRVRCYALTPRGEQAARAFQDRPPGSPATGGPAPSEATALPAE